MAENWLHSINARMLHCDLGEGRCCCDAFMLFLIRANNCFKKSVGKPALPFHSFFQSVGVGRDGLHGRHRVLRRPGRESGVGPTCGEPHSGGRALVSPSAGGSQKEEHTGNAGETGALSHVWGPWTFTRIHTLSQAPQWRVKDAHCPELIT